MAKNLNIPKIRMPRSKFDLSYSYKTMFNMGTCVPFLVQEVYPGDSFKVDTSMVIRTSTPFIRPIMDNLFADVYYFFVPSRLCYDKWQNVLGENSDSYWTETEVPEVPSIIPNSDTDMITRGSLADFMGIPAGAPIDPSIKFNIMPFRANALIYNEWFRNENTQAPVYVNTGDNPTDEDGKEIPEEFNGNAWAPDNIFGMQFNINKLKDYFTACLPEPQKGNAVELPFSGFLPVGTEDPDICGFASTNLSDIYNQYDLRLAESATGEGGPLGYDINDLLTSSVGLQVGQYNFDNAVAFLDRDFAKFPNVNDLRFAVALQRALEKDARGGTRYIEYLYNHFGVISPDARLQRPEFLGGHRTPLQVSQVAQTAPNSTSGTSDSKSYLAQVAGLSLTSGYAGFSKGFVEHGYVIGYVAVRQHHTYQGGIPRMYTRMKRYDFYDPVFSFISEQPVYKYELFAVDAGKDNIFGYNEAFADLRFNFSKITGDLTSFANQGFDIWHLGDDFDSAPSLTGEFCEESSANLDRCLSVPSTTAPNFIIDAYHDIKAVRVLPTFGIPGMIDHM